MPYRLLNVDSLIGDLIFFITLQIVAFDIENNLKLQFSGLAGSMLAVRTIDGKISLSDCLKVGISGMILANFLGFFWCDWRGIDLHKTRAYFCFFILGFFSDIILRGVKSFGISAVLHIPDLTKSAAQKIKDLFLK